MSSATQSSATHPIPQEAFDWYDEYAHGVIDRREFLDRLTTLSAAGFSLSVLLVALTPNYSLAEQVSFNDPTSGRRMPRSLRPRGTARDVATW